jgi:hypothetical protein
MAGGAKVEKSALRDGTGAGILVPAPIFGRLARY